MRIALLGDSVFAGFGLPPGDVPAARLQAMCRDARVHSFGVPDETAADGLDRVATVEADLVSVEFGLNDAIEGVHPDETIAALNEIARRLVRRGAAVAIVEALVSRGSRWPALVDQTGMARRAAEESGPGFVPDILALAGKHLQDDGLHPDGDGARRIAAALSRHVEDVRGGGASRRQAFAT